MLPPLGAALSASVDYQTSARPGLPTPIVSNASSTSPAIALPANLLSGGRIDILSLSGQTQMTRGLPVFAEAVGAFLKIPRREGESLVDYSQRLAEAVKSLTASQRAVLEQSIAQLVRGMTLRMLTEILSNPLGPEAARLNAHLETSAPAGRDPAARAVVSSYRQNAAADLATASPATSSLGTSVAPDGAARGGPDRTGSSPGSTPAEAVGGRPASSPTQGSAGLAADNAAEAGVRPEDGADAVANERTAGLTSRTDGALPGPERARNALQPGGVPLPEVSDDGAPSLPRATNLEARGTSGAGTAEADPQSGASGARGAVMSGTGGAPVIYDAPSLIRMAQRVPEEAKNRFVQEVLYQAALATDAAGMELPASAEDGPAPLPAPVTASEAEEALPSGLRPDAVRTTAGPDGSQMARASLAGSTEDLPPPLPATTAETGARSQVAQSPFEAAAFVAAAPMVAREGLMQAFVAYPPVQPPAKEEERDVERVTAIGEEGENRPSHQDAQGGQQGADDDEPSNDGDGDSDMANGGDDPHAVRAEDLYWRMADLT